MMKGRFSITYQLGICQQFTSVVIRAKAKMKDGEQIYIIFIAMHCTLLEWVEGIVVGC